MTTIIIAEPCNYCPQPAVDYVDVPTMDGTAFAPVMKRVFFCAEHWHIWAERATKFAKASKASFKS